MAEQAQQQEVKRWLSDPPTNCDICGVAITKTFIDGRTRPTGIWGCLCQSCHAFEGCGLGTGRGQRYDRQVAADGKVAWIKTAG